MRGFTFTVLAVVTSAGLSTASLAGKSFVHGVHAGNRGSRIAGNLLVGHTAWVHGATRLLIVRPTSAYCCTEPSLIPELTSSQQASMMSLVASTTLGHVAT